MPNNMYEAVVFFDDGKISKEMRFSEFEAVLDGYVGIPELSQQNAQCCYLQLNKDLSIRAAVFFILSFHEKGMPDPNWDIPIEMMARDVAGDTRQEIKGICRISRANSPIERYTDSLWEPLSDDVYEQLYLAVQRNKLAFNVQKPIDDIPTVNEKIDVAVEDGSVLSVNSQEAIEKRVDRLKAAYKKKLHVFEERRKLDVEHLLQKERNAHHASVEKLMAMIDKLAVENSNLKENTSEHKSEVDLLQTELANHLNSAQVEIAGQQKSLDKLELEKSSLEAVIAKQKTDIIDLQEQIAELSQTVSDIPAIEQNYQKEKETIISTLIDKLTEQDIVFVAYSSGAGHMSLAANKLLDFLDHPIKYAAEKCNVSEAQYILWNAHFKSPVCDECGQKISKVTKPSEFQDGINNRCIRHKQIGK